MNGRRGAWLVLALVAGPVFAGPHEGRLEVTVTDGTTHLPMLGVQVCIAPDTVRNTDENGLCVFDPLPAGIHLMTAVKDQRYRTYEATVTVLVYPPTTQVPVVLERLSPSLELAVVEPSTATVGNTVNVVYRLKFQDMAYTPVKLYLWWWDEQAGRSGVIIDNASFDVNQIPEWQIIDDE